MSSLADCATLSLPVGRVPLRRIGASSSFLSLKPLPFFSSPGGSVSCWRRGALRSITSSLASPVETHDSKWWEAIEKVDDELELMDPEFYRMGYARHVRAYGVEFKEGSKGIGVYAAKDMAHLKSARVIMEIPMELMVTVSKDLPWMFHPNIVPFGHPLFEIINSTHPETDWDLRLACLLLLALDQEESFWQLYSDYLPGYDDITSLLLATEEEVLEVHDDELANVIASQKKRGLDFWKHNWTADSVLKVKRLARRPDQFLWALATVWSRKFIMTMTIGSKVQEAHMLIPYADMLNHSFKPTCALRWRRNDRMVEVVMKPGQTIKRGDEMTLNYAPSEPNATFMQFYGFSSPKNPFDKVNFSGNAMVHQDSFQSAFNLAGLDENMYYNEAISKKDNFVDGAILAAERTLPKWSEKDLPFLPSQEMKAAKELKKECEQLLMKYSTTLEEDEQICASGADRNPRWRAAVKYRMDRKRLIRRIAQALDLYVLRILY